MGRHAKSTVWMLRKLGRHPDLPNGMVRTVNREQPLVEVWEPENRAAQRILMDRRTAALVARRIIECLEATR